MDDVNLFWSVLLRDPYLFFGLVLFAVPAVSSWRIYTSLRGIGFRYKGGSPLPASWLEAYVREYAKTRSKFGWPAWPLYAGWIALLAGVPLVVVGIFRL